MITSILISIKKMLGIESSYTHFDQDIIFGINSAIMSLNQLGIGPTTCMVITGDDEEWSTLLGSRTDIESVKSFIYLKVRLLFDPPSSNFVLEAMERQIKEFEWRLMVQVDPPIVIEEVVEEEEEEEWGDE